MLNVQDVVPEASCNAPPSTDTSTLEIPDVASAATPDTGTIAVEIVAASSGAEIDTVGAVYSTVMLMVVESVVSPAPLVAVASMV